MLFVKKKFYTVLFFMASLILVSAGSIQAEEKYDDAILEKFAKAVVGVMSIQQESQVEMMQLIEKQGMSVERYNELMMHLEQGQPLENPPAEEEQEKYKKISEALGIIQRGLQEKLVNAVESNDISIEQYEAIVQDYQTDPELKQRIDKLLE